MKILTVIGARPQFIKAAALSREFKKHAEIEEIIVHTGQHFDNKMSSLFFDEMDIPQPTYNLEVHNLSHGAMTGRMLEAVEQVIIKEKADLLLIYGDTNSTLAGALAAKKLHIKVAHVEAGMRSFNMEMPEEINRILSDRISDILFCSTDTAMKNLVNEGFNDFGCSMVKSGDVMQDAALYYAAFSADKSEVLNKLGLSEFILCTVHRAENTDDPTRFRNIVQSLNELHKKIPVVLPLHPRTSGVLKKYNLQLDVNSIDPVGYFDMIELLKHCSVVITDSGGLQKEAFFFGKHCVTMREQTEWVELLEHGFNILSGTNPDLIKKHTISMMNKSSDFNINLYGAGEACSVITNYLLAASDK